MQVTNRYIRVVKLGDRTSRNTDDGSTPSERLAMVWPLTVTAWKFRGVDIAERRLSRHAVRVLRRER